MSKKKAPLKPITIITALLDLDDRLGVIEKKLGIKNKPFLVRTRKWRR